MARKWSSGERQTSRGRATVTVTRTTRDKTYYIYLSRVSKMIAIHIVTDVTGLLSRPYNGNYGWLYRENIM